METNTNTVIHLADYDINSDTRFEVATHEVWVVDRFEPVHETMDFEEVLQFFGGAAEALAAVSDGHAVIR